MNDRKAFGQTAEGRRKHEPPRGVLQDLRMGALTLRRYYPCHELAALIEHHWVVTWDMGEAASHAQRTLPHPSVHLVAEQERFEVFGVVSGAFTKHLEGQGRAVGVKFRPGAFAAFVPNPIAALTDCVVDAADLFGETARMVGRAMGEGTEEGMASVESWLLAQHPCLCRDAQLAGELVEAIEGDRTLVRVDRLAAEQALSVRRVQRLFQRYVGVSPKWVIRRYRLHEALARVSCGQKLDQVALALELGYCDQAHFIRDFKAMVGETPAAYSSGHVQARSVDASS